MVGAMRRVLTVALLAACGPSSSTTAPTTHPPIAVVPPPPAAEPTPPTLRLPNVARPLHETVELAIDPASEDFTGTITTELEVLSSTSTIWLDAQEITVDKATIGSATARVVTAPKDYLALVVDAPLPVGRTTMTITYRGKMHRDDGDGIYTVKEGNDIYAFTQFEATDARQAFPCFDEPAYKIPWQVSIRTKKAQVALSNTPIEAETDAGNGDKLVRFAETRPLPSYLVAFAVGPFEAVDAGKTRGGAPIRIVAPRGHGGELAYAAEATKPLLDRLEDYFGIPYPFPKLDLLAVPVFNAGAMENPGLITFRQSILAVKPGQDTLDTRERFATVAAHEMAHMWFGDLVTLAWWDDTWLNESFATWMETKIIEAWKPEWDVGVDRVATKLGVMGQDSLDSARTIRQPIESKGDIETAFDGITYQKGEAVLTMIEARVGAAVFQQGVRAYLAAHASRNATYDDFVSAMSTAAGTDLHPVFDAFVKQSGVPVVSFALSCADKAHASLALAQRRYAPVGSKIDPKRTWQLPICVRWGAGKDRGRDCTTLAAETGELALSSKTCPDWVGPNEGGLGYYHAAATGKTLDTLLARAGTILTLPERINLIGDVRALVASGEIDNGKALALIASLAKEHSRHIVDASVGIVAGISEMVPDDLRTKYEKLILRLYRARATELGWHSKPNEDADRKQLRPTLLAMVAGEAHDPALVAEAKALAWKWLDDHKAIEPELVGVALSVAAIHGDQKLFDRLHADAKKTTDREERGHLLGAMGAFEDPKIVDQAMALVLTDEFELRESIGLLQGGFANRKTRVTAYNFVKEHYDAISEKLPLAYRPYMAYTVVALCDEGRRAEIEAFFKPRIEKLDGGALVMKQALEGMSLCAAQRKAQQPGVTAFLKKS